MERSFFCLNIDGLLLKIRADIRSKSGKSRLPVLVRQGSTLACFCGNSKHHPRVSDETRRKPAFDSLKNELRSCSTGQERTYVVGLGKTTYCMLGLISFEFKSVCVGLFAIRFAKKQMQWYLYRYNRPSCRYDLVF